MLIEVKKEELKIGDVIVYETRKDKRILAKKYCTFLQTNRGLK